MASTSNFELLQHWKGVVSEVDTSEMFVILKDLTDPTKPDLSAIIGLDQVADTDLHLVVPGAEFDFRIGYTATVGKKSLATCRIKFKANLVWTREDLERGRAQADKIACIFEDTEGIGDT